MAAEHSPPSSRGPYFDDLEIGRVYKSQLGRTVTETDNILFTHLILNANQIHFNDEYAKRSQFGRVLVNSTFTLALITGLTTNDISQNAVANLGWSDVVLPKPVFIGDTLWAETEILDKRLSRSRPGVGIVETRSRGLNQNGEVVIAFRRTIMIHTRESDTLPRVFPDTDEAWPV